MKKVKKYILVAAASLLVYSCNDALDIRQAGEAQDQQAFQTASDLEKFLVGSVYTSADITSQIKFSSLFTDELKVGPANAGQDQSTFRFVIIPNDPFVEGIWSGQYLLINRVNQLIDKSALITPASTTDVALYNNTLAEARVLRAFAYLNLMTYYSTDLKNDNALGVILADKIYPFETKLPRVKNSDIWNFVEADLAYADTNLNATAAANHPAPYFINKNVVSALRARMYLYRGNYTLAKQYAQAAVTGSGLALTLAAPIPTGTVGSTAWNNTFYTQSTTPSPYRKMLFDDIIGENIFKLSRPSVGLGGNIAGMYTTNNTSISGSPWWVTGINLYNTYGYTSNDIRKYAYVDPTSDATKQNYVIDKYPGKNATPLKNDIKIFRISEMYLILAECAVRANDLPTAASYVKQIRDARKWTGTTTLPTYGTAAAAFVDILRERRIELSFEGHRFIDLKRLGAEAGVSIDRNATDDFLTGTPLTLSLTDYRWTLPIPSSELNGNPGIAQNPGY
ncbi:RagB/SusD family nutrient uptake outer membrane protein [Chryseobacterium sp. Tr-659]|uniref:RagB/SusD family nutrient uptake outer membrane protein n=1 Tax=Chryseobacterium sp. Tr-659 TaxID=2608340 RepID=UPI001421B457|nr:RagB/SusD family nutrient uptake outer membrane protein [Chryseobacterium sp. Tr-659]NIF05465.1 RagB/SusD family nutrient uptake outer membrane protein [Chryseobacterium sp. Tr-659]